MDPSLRPSVFSPGSAPSSNPSDAPLIGQVGQDFVQLCLSTQNPTSAVTEIQTKGALKDDDGDQHKCAPLLGLLDQLGLSRSESHKYVLQSATDQLMSYILKDDDDNSNSGDHHDKLQRLLEASFPFVGIPILRAIPFAVLDKLHPNVPKPFIRQLAADPDLFWACPPSVQRQVLEGDVKQLQSHALPLLNAYTHEVATVLRALDMMMSGGSGGGDKPGGCTTTTTTNTTNMTSAALVSKATANKQQPQLSRRALRRGSASLQKLTQLVGQSSAIYKRIVDLIIARFREGGGGGVASATKTTSTSSNSSTIMGVYESGLCALRAQLLMSLHDQGVTEVCGEDGVYRFILTLDSCVKEGSGGGGGVGRIDEEKLSDLSLFLKQRDPDNRYNGGGGFDHEYQARQPPMILPRKRGRITATSRAAANGGSGYLAREDDAESAGAPGHTRSQQHDPLKELADASMALRDPPIYHYLLHQVIMRLEQVVEGGELPKNDDQLQHLIELLALACGCREMVVTSRRRLHAIGTVAYAAAGGGGGSSSDLPRALPDVMATLLPELGEYIVDDMLREGDDNDDNDGTTNGTTTVSVSVLPEWDGNKCASLVALMTKDELSRRLVETLILQRLEKRSSDVSTAWSLLNCVAAALNAMVLKHGGEGVVQQEFAPFAFTLAKYLLNQLNLYQNNNEAAKSSSGLVVFNFDQWWSLCFDKILIRLVDSDKVVHEEVLRLLLAAATIVTNSSSSTTTKCLLTAAKVGEYINATLKATKRSRSLTKKYTHAMMMARRSSGGKMALIGRQQMEEEEDEDDDDVTRMLGAGEVGKGMASADGVKGTYALFTQKVAGLNGEVAPALFAYLEEKD